MLPTNHLAKNLQYLRKARELSQQKLADILGLTRSKIASYESGKAEPNAATIYKIIGFFEISFRQLIHEDLEKISARTDVKNSADESEDPDQSLDGFTARLTDLRKIADGLMAMHQIKKSTVKDRQVYAQSLERDVEICLEFIDTLLGVQEDILGFVGSSVEPVASVSGSAADPAVRGSSRA
jgi:transcriptional regulator with XRE-family HTH domain